MCSNDTFPPHILNTYSGIMHPGSIEQERASDSMNCFNRAINSVLIALLILSQHNLKSLGVIHLKLASPKSGKAGYIFF